ncbi:MAG: hypothetical protein IJ111_00945 [Eggerthellaceae bacterium]|nr:hypothetical protein [Eggerthellaceae bacterium]
MRGWGYDTSWIGEYFVRHFTFDSLEDYLAYLETAETHEAFLRGSQASEAGSEEFTLTTSLDEAMQLCRFGWHDGFNDLVALVERVKRRLDIKIDPNRTFHDYVGFAPDVKAYLEGSPLTMINKPVVHKPLVTIYMNTSYAGNEANERIYSRGAVVLAAAEALELMGFMVDLRLFELSYVDKDIHFSEYRLKMPDERVNLQKLYFPLCHPAWVRRLNFRLIETSPNMTDAWAGCYGIPAEVPMIRMVLGLGAGDILIPTIEEMKLEGEDVLEDAQKLFERINVGLPSDKQLVLR